MTSLTRLSEISTGALLDIAEVEVVLCYGLPRLSFSLHEIE
jgi:hypothetical protein